MKIVSQIWEAKGYLPYTFHILLSLIIVAAHASNYAVGAVITHLFSNGSEKVTTHVSGTRSAAENNTCEIDKAFSAIICAVN